MQNGKMGYVILQIQSKKYSKIICPLFKALNIKSYSIYIFCKCEYRKGCHRTLNTIIQSGKIHNK